MDQKVIAAFVVFGVSLIAWGILALINKPELGSLLTFVQGICATSWTAAALFIDPKSSIPNVQAGDTPAQPSSNS